jgi:hypothetical protein
MRQSLTFCLQNASDREVQQNFKSANFVAIVLEFRILPGVLAVWASAESTERHIFNQDTSSRPR